VFSGNGSAGFGRDDFQMLQAEFNIPPINNKVPAMKPMPPATYPLYALEAAHDVDGSLIIL
jgi:hypothetical protein